MRLAVAVLLAATFVDATCDLDVAGETCGSKTCEDYYNFEEVCDNLSLIHI